MCVQERDQENMRIWRCFFGSVGGQILKASRPLVFVSDIFYSGIVGNSENKR